MFAIIKTGGKQYRVKGGDIIHVERLSGKEGEKIKFEEVLSTSDGKTTKIGAPTLSGAYVTAQYLGEEKADKVIIFKKKRRHNYRRKKGHRQILTALQITSITVDGKTIEAENFKPAKKAGRVTPAVKGGAKAKPAAKAAKPAAEKKTAAKKPDAKPAAKKAATKPAAKKTKE